MGSSTGNPDKKNLRKQAKMVTQKDPGLCRKRMEKTTREKITVQLEEINQKVKQYRQNKTFQNNERNFYQIIGGYDTRTYQQPDARETANNPQIVP